MLRASFVFDFRGLLAHLETCLGHVDGSSEGSAKHAIVEGDGKRLLEVSTL
jgi:hypothetical protein